MFLYSTLCLILLLLSGEVAMGRMGRNADSAAEASSAAGTKRGMVLPFTPLAMSFDDVRYFVDMPAVTILLPLETLESPLKIRM